MSSIGCLCATALISAVAAEGEPMFLFDMTALNEVNLSDPAGAREAWDTAHLVASVQGIVNRDGPRLFVRFMPHPDDFWWDHLRSEGEWLAGREVKRLDAWQDVLRAFEDRIRGVVVYDERVWATSNLASTIAGVEDRLCLRYDSADGSVYQRVMGFGLPFTKNVKRLLNEDGSPMFTGAGEIPGTGIASTGSAKCDAYLWAKHHYLDAGRCSAEFMAYYIDAYWLTRPTESSLANATLTNHDFFIANRAFFFDLGMWEEESPVDDPGQKPGTDVRTIEALLRSMYDQAGGRIVHIGGFVPWVWKYTDHGNAGGRHGGVDSEWKYAQIISAYNGIMDADALGISGMANASFYQHHPLKARYPQNERPTAASLEARGLILDDGSVAGKAYICFYMGDYDAAAWLNYHVPLWWQDPAHGDTVCTWAFNPNLDRRAPHAMHFARTRQSPNDWFMFGDSGAGYLNPGMLAAPRAISGLPDGFEAWVAHNMPYAERYDLSITGFIIDGHSPGMGERGMAAYMRFSPDGIVGQKIPAQGVFEGVMPFVRMRLDLHGNPPDAGRRLADLARLNLPKFLFVRTILKSPSWHSETMAAARAANPNLEVVDPYTFFLLVKQYELGGAKQSRAVADRESAVLTAPDKTDGLAPIRVEDGPFKIAEDNGKPVLVQTRRTAVAYLYFEVDDTMAQPFQLRDNTTAEVVVTLLDRAPGEVGIQYDSHHESAYTNGGFHRLRGSGEWIALRFLLPRAAFAHGQNGGADFRLVNKGADLCVHRVELRAAR